MAQWAPLVLKVFAEKSGPLDLPARSELLGLKACGGKSDRLDPLARLGILVLKALEGTSVLLDLPVRLDRRGRRDLLALKDRLG